MTPRVVIIGCGFGGLWAAQHLRRAAQVAAKVEGVKKVNNQLKVVSQ